MTRPHWLWLLTLLGGAGCAGTPIHDAEGLLCHLPPENAITTQSAADPSSYHVLPQPEITPREPAAPPAPPSNESPMRYPPSAVPEDHAAPPAPAAQEAAPAPPTAASPVAPPPTPDRPLVAAMNCMLAKPPQSAEAVALLRNYSPANQEVLLSLLTLCAQISDDGEKNPSPKSVAATIYVMEQTAQRLREKASLVLDKMCFCKWIDKFGVFEAMPDGQPFTPGSLVHIYVELRNFASEQRDHDHCYETHLASTVKLLDGQDKVAAQWGFTDRTRPERSQTLRHDYFINYSLRIPENIPPGKYLLQLSVDDLPTKRSVERRLSLDITPRPAGTD